MKTKKDFRHAFIRCSGPFHTGRLQVAAVIPQHPPEDLPQTLPLKAALPVTAAPQTHPEILRCSISAYSPLVTTMMYRTWAGVG